MNPSLFGNVNLDDCIYIFKFSKDGYKNFKEPTQIGGDIIKKYIKYKLKYLTLKN